MSVSTLMVMTADQIDGGRFVLENNLQITRRYIGNLT